MASAATLLMVLTVTLAADPLAKLPVPDAKAIAEAEKLVQEIYRADFGSARTVELKIALAKKLADQAGETSDDPAGKYVLYRQSIDLSAAAGDVELASETMTKLSAAFDVDPYAIQIETLTSLSRSEKDKTRQGAIAKKAIEGAKAAVVADKLKTAEKLAALALSSARRSGNADVKQQATEVGKVIRDIEKFSSAAERAKDALEKNPDDAKAALDLGKYYAFLLGDWEKALPLLAKCSDPALKSLAEKDLATKDVAKHSALGDMWYDAAQKESGVAATGMKSRAALYYESCIGSLAGLAKAKVESRLDEIRSQSKTALVKSSRKMKLAELKIESKHSYSHLNLGESVIPNENRYWILNEQSPELAGLRVAAPEDNYQGRTDFSVVEPGIVIIAVAFEQGGSGGDWEKERVTRDELIKQGWTALNYRFKINIEFWVFARQCRKGESFKIRTVKYAAPVIFLEWNGPEF